MKRIMAVLSALICFASAAFAESFINLTTVKNDIVVTDGTRIHSVLPNTGKISIAPNATVTLWMAIIQESTTKTGAGITCMGDATIILEGENYVCGRSSDYPAIYVPEGSTLTIKGTGKLTAIGNGYAAGIGGGEGKNCGNIVIDGGVITAEGGRSSDNGNITYFTDDMIIPPDSNYRQNTIVIRPPSADGGGPGIGAGDNATCGKITFKRGIVTAWANGEVFNYPAIGASAINSSCGSVEFKQTIGKVEAVVSGSTSSEDKIVKADNVNYGVVAGVKDGWAGTNKKKLWTGYPGQKKNAIDTSLYRTLTVSSQLGSLSGSKTFGDEYDVGSNIEWRRTVLRGELSGDYRITIADGTEVVFDGVTIAGGLTSDMPGITIQGSATIILKGENYISGHGEYSSGIYVGEGGDLSIQGDGSLTVVSGGKYAAAIGGNVYGRKGSVPCGKITILSGEITAIGGEFASALGGFFKGTDGEVNVYGDQVRIYGGSLHARGGVPLRDQDETYLSGGIKCTHSGNEEFFRWNGRLDQIPGYFDDLPDGYNGGDEIYLVAHTGTVITGDLPPPTRQEIPDGPVLIHDREIRIAAGAKVTIKDAFIERPACGMERAMNEGAVFARKKNEADWYNYSMMEATPRYHAGIRCMGDAEIEIKGDNQIWATKYQAGLSVAEGKKLTLKGGGTLSVYGGLGGGGIDGGSEVIVENGVVNAFGGDGGSGIGADRIEFKGGSTTVVAYETEASDELADFHALGYSESSEIVVGGSLKRETEEIAGLNASGHFKNCTEKISFNGHLDDVGEEGENGAKGGGTKKMMMLASAMPRLLGAGDTDLSEIDGPDSEAIAGDGTVISGTLAGRHKISVAPDATVTLRNAVIPGTSDASSPYAGLTCLGNAKIILEGVNEISSFHGSYPGIYVPEGSTLTIDGTGTLTASCTGSSSSYASGIGGGYKIGSGNVVVAGGNVVIEGGTVVAEGGIGAAGIGGGFQSRCGDIEIKGGTVTATGGTSGGAGIGSGCAGSCGNIAIRSGIVRVAADGYGSAQDVGSGVSGSKGTLSISSVLSKTTEGNYAVYKWSGNLGVDGDGDTFELTALDGTTISGSNVQGTYKRVRVKIAPGAKVTLSSATIDASLQNLPNSIFLGAVAQWAGITCLGDAEITLVGYNKVDTFNCE